MTTSTVHLGFEIGTGMPVSIPLRHMVVTGQTQEAGKTTTLEALIARAGVQAVAFITKRGEGSFAGARTIAPYFSEHKTEAGYIEWRYVAAILEASLGEKLKFERSWIMRATKGATTLAEVQQNVRRELDNPKTKGLSADVYFSLNEYLQAVVPQIARVRWARQVELAPGINAMDLGAIGIEMQHLVIRSTIEWVLAHGTNTVVVVPEAWKFIPQGRGTPVKLAAEAFIRQAAACRNYLWLDSQDIAGIEKLILKSVPVWILGVQREINEVKRTLEQMPVAVPKLTPRQIATLKLGEFYACYGDQAIKTYVQPIWLTPADALAVARGEVQLPPRVQSSAHASEGDVTEQEAADLRAENAELRRRIGALEEALAGRPVGTPGAKRPDVEAGGRDGAAPPSPAPAHPPAARGNGVVDEDLYQAIKARLAEEVPALLQVLTVSPELEIAVTRETIRIDGKTLPGRLAQLLAKGFFDQGCLQSHVRTELERRGASVSDAKNLARELAALTERGFLTMEDGKDSKGRARTLYVAVPGMKVRVLEGGA